MRKTRMTGGVIRVFVYREKTAADVWNTAALILAAFLYRKRIRLRTGETIS